MGNLASKALKEFSEQKETSSLSDYLAERGIYSVDSFDDMSSTWVFQDSSSIKAGEQGTQTVIKGE